MKLGKSMKILVGVFTLWPSIYMFVFFSFIFSTVFFPPQGGASPQETLFPFQVLFALHFFTMIAIMALIGFYIVYLFKSNRVAQDKKTLWAVVIFLGNMIAMPIFWYLYIWKEPQDFIFATPPAQQSPEIDA